MLLSFFYQRKTLCLTSPHPTNSKKLLKSSPPLVASSYFSSNYRPHQRKGGWTQTGPSLKYNNVQEKILPPSILITLPIDIFFLNLWIFCIVLRVLTLCFSKTTEFLPTFHVNVETMRTYQRNHTQCVHNITFRLYVKYGTVCTYTVHHCPSYKHTYKSKLVFYYNLDVLVYL